MPIENLKSVAHLNQLLKNYRVLIVDVYTKWCGPCKLLQPKLELLSNDYMNDTVIFVKEDGDSTPIHTVQGYPTIVFYVDNKKYNTILGLNFNGIVETLNKIFEELNLLPKVIERNQGIGSTITQKVLLNKKESYSAAYSDGYARFSDMAEIQGKMPETYLPQGSSIRKEPKKS